LLELLLPRLDRALRQGTTVMEAKSGYGLDLEAEAKLLRVLYRASQLHPVSMLCSASRIHAVGYISGRSKNARCDVRHLLMA